MWTQVRNISGLDLYVSYDEDKIKQITTQKPNEGILPVIHERFRYITDFLENHTKHTVFIEAFDDLDLSWTTPFQYKIYKTAAMVPCGTLISYGALAGLAGRPKAARAVGAAMTANRFSIIIPAHRVVGAGRKLSGTKCNHYDSRIQLLHSEGIYDFK